MSFQLLPDLDKNKVFLVNSSELEGRLDPHFYEPQFIENEKSLQKIGCSKLSQQSFSIFSGITPKSGGDAYSDRELGIPFVRSGDFLENGKINFAELLYIKPEIHNGIMKGSKIKQNDLLVAIVGATIGKVGIYKDNKDANINQAIAAVRLQLTLKPEFVRAFLLTSIGQKVIDRIKRPVARANINLEEVGSFNIPNFSFSKQNKVIQAMDTAYTAKKQKEAEAQRLLDSIDYYLLGELGIELLEQEENTLQSRMFTRWLSEVSGGRFDAPIHQKKYLLETTKYPMSRFGDCLLINPLTSFYGYSPETLATFIPMEKVSDQYGEADISGCRTLEESSGYTKFQNNDLIWAKITPCMQNGKSAVVTELKNGIGFGSTEFHVFRAKQKIDIRYIYGLLRLRSLRKYAVLYFSGSAGHQRVADEFFKRLSIPKPPLKKQTKIAGHITKIRNQAKQLQQEAKAEVEQAKKEVDIMILGEDESKA